jgi:uncharacterized protein (UPF0332 family)
VTPELSGLLDKARDCLVRVRIILAVGVGEDAGRDAYLAGFHAAQSLIRAHTGKTAKTHRGGHRMMSRLGRNEFAAGRPRPVSVAGLKPQSGC